MTKRKSEDRTYTEPDFYPEKQGEPLIGVTADPPEVEEEQVETVDVPEPIKLPEVEPEPEPSQATPAVEEMVTVRFLNTNLYDGRYIVMDVQSSQGYLVPVEELQWTTKDQMVSRTVLEAADRPYDFARELEALYIDPQAVRIALWRSGVVDQAGAKQQSLNSLLSRLVNKGIFPVKAK